MDDLEPSSSSCQEHSASAKEGGGPSSASARNTSPDRLLLPGEELYAGVSTERAGPDPQSSEAISRKADLRHVAASCNKEEAWSIARIEEDIVNQDVDDVEEEPVPAAVAAAAVAAVALASISAETLPTLLGEIEPPVPVRDAVLSQEEPITSSNSAEACVLTARAMPAVGGC